MHKEILLEATLIFLSLSIGIRILFYTAGLLNIYNYTCNFILEKILKKGLVYSDNLFIFTLGVYCFYYLLIKLPIDT
jgi:hypothetical protein